MMRIRARPTGPRRCKGRPAARPFFPRAAFPPPLRASSPRPAIPFLSLSSRFGLALLGLKQLQAAHIPSNHFRPPRLHGTTSSLYRQMIMWPTCLLQTTECVVHGSGEPLLRGCHCQASTPSMIPGLFFVPALAALPIASTVGDELECGSLSRGHSFCSSETFFPL
jgi:hypothetical protein